MGRIYKMKSSYNCRVQTKTGFSVNESFEGETIEQKVERIVTMKEPISDASPIIFTERNAGVMPEYNPRTDRWEIAVDAMDKIHKGKIAKSEGKVIKLNEDSNKVDGIDGTTTDTK